ncbi:MAG TPA: F0F1 ATP synthase subunit B [Candidatus Hypogeohydataceae bacterium YC41]
MEFLRVLGVDIKLVIVQALGFLILLYLLRRFLFDKIFALIKARREEIKDTYEKTEKDKQAAARLKAEYERKVSATEDEAEKKLTEAVKEAKKISAEVIDRARQEAEVIKLKAQETLELERRKVAQEIRNQVVTLSLLTSQRLIQQSLSQETAERLVDEFTKEAEELRC